MKINIKNEERIKKELAKVQKDVEGKCLTYRGILSKYNKLKDFLGEKKGLPASAWAGTILKFHPKVTSNSDRFKQEFTCARIILGPVEDHVEITRKTLPKKYVASSNVKLSLGQPALNWIAQHVPAQWENEAMKKI